MSATRITKPKGTSCRTCKECELWQRKGLRNSMYAHGVSAPGWLRRLFNEAWKRSVHYVALLSGNLAYKTLFNLQQWKGIGIPFSASPWANICHRVRYPAVRSSWMSIHQFGSRNCNTTKRKSSGNCGLTGLHPWGSRSAGFHVPFHAKREIKNRNSNHLLRKKSLLWKRRLLK